jgi:uncharacterized protein involved in exopolysaccharide biosynthesis
MAEWSQEKTLKDIFRAMFCHRRLLLLGAALFAIVAMVVSHYIPLEYTTTAIFERRADAATDDISKNTESFEPMKLTLHYELAGPKAIERAIDDLGLTSALAHGSNGELTSNSQDAKQRLTNDLQRDIKVTWPVRSGSVDRIMITFTHSDPWLVEHLPNTLVRNYITAVSDQITERLESSRNFLQAEIEKHKKRLADLSGQKVAFEAKNGNTALVEPGDLQDRARELTSDIDALCREENISLKKLVGIQTMIRSTKQNRLKKQLTQLKEELDTQLTVGGMTHAHPTVQTLSSTIAQLEKQLKETPETSVADVEQGDDPLLRDLSLQLAVAESALEAVRSERSRLERRLDSLKAVMVNTSAIRQEYLEIAGPVEQEQVQLDRWQKRLTETSMAIDSEAANRRTQLGAIQWASKPFQPIAPRLWMVLGLSIGGGLLFGYALAFVASQLGRAIATTRDAARYFDLPIHGIISEIVTPAQRLAQKLKRRTLTATVSLLMVSCLVLASLSVVLRLKYPEHYRQWRSSPSKYVYAQIVELAKNQVDKK